MNKLPKKSKRRKRLIARKNYIYNEYVELRHMFIEDQVSFMMTLENIMDELQNLYNLEEDTVFFIQSGMRNLRKSPQMNLSLLDQISVLEQIRREHTKTAENVLVKIRLCESLITACNAAFDTAIPLLE